MLYKHVTGDPNTLVLADRNARFMSAPKYQQLVANIKDDGALGQWPLIWVDPHSGTRHVLSGNHRVRASLDAGLTQIDWIEFYDDISPSRRRAIQLSHNQLIGEDDPIILEELIGEIDPEDQDYTGFPETAWEEVEAEPVSVPEPDEATTIMLTFLPDDEKRARAILDELDDLQGGMERWLAAADQYKPLFEVLTAARKSLGTRNVTGTLVVLLDMVNLHIADLREGWYDVEQQLETRDAWVPTASLGLADIPSDAAAVLARAIDHAVHTGEVNHPWQLLELLAADYLAQ